MVTEIMNFEEFANNVKENVGKYFPDTTIEVNIQIVNKNNVKLTGLVVREKDNNLAPTIYLENFYNDFKEGRDIEGIVHEIADIAKRSNPKVDLNIFKDANKIKELVMPKMVGQIGNEAFLKDKPHTVIQDMASVYYIPLDKEGSMTVTLNNKHLETLGITKEEIHKAAMGNIGKANMKIVELNEMLKEIMRGQGMPEFLIDDFVQNSANGPKVYFVSNENGHFGAGILANTEALNKAVREFNPEGEPVFIIPSSIHEILIVPDDGSMTVEDIKNMVCEVNATQVAPEERLTDNVYSFDPESRELTEAEDKDKGLD